MSQIDVCIKDDGVKISYDNGGRKIVKNVSVDDFINSITKDVVQRTGLLSRGVREVFSYGDNDVVTIEIPPRIRDMVFSEDKMKKTYSVPFPSLVFVFWLNGGTIRESWCFATKDPIHKGDAELHYFPYGNVYPDGRICWGDTAFLGKNKYNTSNISAVVTRFLQAPFNRDLAEEAFTPPKKGVNSTLRLLQHLDGTYKFPKEILRPTLKYDKRIEKIFEHVKKER